MHTLALILGGAFVVSGFVYAWLLLIDHAMQRFFDSL